MHAKATLPCQKLYEGLDILHLELTVPLIMVSCHVSSFDYRDID